MAQLKNVEVPDTEGEIDNSQWDIMTEFNFSFPEGSPFAENDEIRRTGRNGGDLIYARIYRSHIQATYCDDSLNAGNTYKSRFNV